MTTAARFVLTLPCMLAAAIPGCGGGQAAGDGGGDASADAAADASADGAVPLSPADQAFLADFCTAVVPCCTTNGLTADVAVCKQSIAKLAWTRDPEVRAACLEELRQRVATSACMPDPGDLADPCTRIFDEPSGPRAPGETCTTAKDCAGSPGTFTNCFGTCITYALGAAGDYPCLGNVGTSGLINAIPWKANSTIPESHGFLCQVRDGLYCDWDTNVCRALVPGGGACTGTQICESGSCGGPSGGVCDPVPGLGDACVLNCAGDTYCNGDVCVPRLAAGAVCAASSDQCSGDCKGSNGCYGTCATAGVCSPLTVVQSLVLGVWCGLTPVRD